MSLRLDLLRHGETERGGGFRGSIDDALTAAGWAQLRQAVAGQPRWDALVSSPLQRCAAFATELATQLDLPLQLEPDLQELHFGEWEGRTALELMQDAERELGLFWQDPYSFTPPGGETLLRFEARVLAALARLQARYAGRHVLLVTHGGVINLLLARARQLPPEQLMQVAAPHGGLFSLQVDVDLQLREC
ncbi:alpha-ribazole phosphatase family protein [Aquipseudomonas ullengensis]|uniref:Alpha-ribazole phosphatase family protein n=1 Tax=Aquipseudomonas ullengensis TaxID=2759166 RepID=A0A7W4LL55_9GAMM|nr:alpha-ribazole phosphatase family protein [Pseudomonas ullengensis]MBB2495148.1 alpha-ribazole phosphatase family protein [Pseudomonas ullengensis]